MSETKQLSPDRMQEYFDGFSKRFLRKDSTPVVDVEVVSFFPGNRLQDRQPVTGATATLSGGTSQRDPGRSTASGHYRFDPVSPGTYTADICVNNNDLTNQRLAVPVTLTVD